MKDFVSGLIAYLSVFVVVPGFSFCYLSGFALFPHLFTALFFLLAVCFAAAFFMMIRSGVFINQLTDEERALENEEYHSAMRDFSRPDYIPGTVQGFVYSAGQKFDLNLDGKRYVAYIHRDGSVLLKNTVTGKSKKIEVLDLRKLRAEERTQLVKQKIKAIKN